MLVDVSGNGPDQLEPCQKGWKSLLNDWQVTFEVLELSLESAEELHEVFGLGVELLEGLVLSVVALKAKSILLLLVGGHHVDDSLHLWHVQLLVESVEGSIALPPVLSLS
jgi:hypothetical protein